MSEDRTQYKTCHENALVVRGVDELQAIGQQFETSGMFGCSAQGQGLVLAMTCVMNNITPLEFQQTYHIINGRVTMRADAMLAKFVERGGKYKIAERSNTRAAATFVKGYNELDAEYSLEDAKQSGICFGKDGKRLKDNWAKFPKQMLWARLVSDSIRAVDPGVASGAVTPEEVSDFSDGGGAIMVGADDSRVEAAKPVEVVEVIDYGVMPAGKNKGVRWEEFDDATLQKVLDAKQAVITERHKDAVQDVLADRAGRVTDAETDDE